VTGLLKRCLGCRHLAVHTPRTSLSECGEPYCMENGSRLWWDDVMAGGGLDGICPRWRSKPWTTGEVRRLLEIRRTGGREWVRRACVALLRPPDAIRKAVQKHAPDLLARRVRMTSKQRMELFRRHAIYDRARREYREECRRLGLTTGAAYNALVRYGPGTAASKGNRRRRERIERQVASDLRGGRRAELEAARVTR